eukprot:6833521-Ditylum_brightwellii.AAC.1
MVDTVQMSVKTDITLNVNLTAHIEAFIKKSLWQMKSPVFFQKEDTNTKEVSNNNIHSTATSSQDSLSVHNDAQNPEYESVNVEDENQMTQTKKKSSTLNKAALI